MGMGFQSRLWQTVDSLEGGHDVLARRRYGMIEMRDGRLQAIHLRPWPKRISLLEIWLWGYRCHRSVPGDRCWLYYNQPLLHSNFLALRYVVSTRDGTLASFHGGLVVLDEIARFKRTDAILCQLTNPRISERLMHRWGWERHLATSRDRHYIKRFYGEYPPPPPASRRRHAAPDLEWGRARDRGTAVAGDTSATRY